MEIDEKSRLLFMKYALPCAGTLVRRCSITQEKWDELIDFVRNENEIPENSEKIFKVAFAACSLIALDLEKKKIDNEVVRDYFLFRHDEIIDKRYEEMGDFDPEACRTRVGVVESVENGYAIVRTDSGTEKFRTDFAKNVKKSDDVVVHWNFVVEKIDKKTATLMKKQKEIMKKMDL